MNLDLDYYRKDAAWQKYLQIDDTINFVHLNQESKYFGACGKNRLHIFHTGKGKFHVKKIALRIKKMCLLHSSNILGFVGEPRLDKFMLYDLHGEVMIWDMEKSSKILNVVLHDLCFVLVFLKRIELYDNEQRLMQTFKTCENPRALCQIHSYRGTSVFLVLPSETIGSVRVFFQPEQLSSSSRNLEIDAFKEPLGPFCVDSLGNKLAVTSQSGKYIKVFCITSLHKNKLENTFYRGKTSIISSLSFSFDSKFLIASSLGDGSQCTIHLWSLKTEENIVSMWGSVSSKVWGGVKSKIQLKEENLRPPAVAKFLHEPDTQVEKKKGAANYVFVVLSRDTCATYEYDSEINRFALVRRKKFVDYMV